MRATVTPGQRVVQLDDDPTGVLIYDGVPDWVTLPAELGGTRATVKHGLNEPCPCGTGHTSLTLVLDATHGDKGLHVAECATRGYLWFAR